jgi:hypothetical protein
MRRPSLPPAVPEGADFALGESPFRVKGVLYLGTQSFFTEHVRGGMEALVAEIEDPALRAFITQKFLPSSLYDCIPVPALIACEARAMRMSLEDYLLHRTRHQAKKDLGGVYAWLLRLASPRLVARNLPRIMVQMFDFAAAETIEDQPQHTVARIAGVPAVLAPWLQVALSVYAETALKLAGATVDAEPPAIVAEGTRAGLPIVTLVLTLRWK